MAAPENFSQSFARFKFLIEAYGGKPFESFDTGIAASWERYKPKLRDIALEKLDSEAWIESDIGSGKILDSAIAAIELDSKDGQANNLVFWQNRYGHNTRDHCVLIDARSGGQLRLQIEKHLFLLFQDSAEEGKCFEALAEITGRKYPLMAYFFFLKDMDRFVPISPSNFDKAFDELAIGIKTRGQCNWQNYSKFVSTIARVRSALAVELPDQDISLLDAHSFCWLLAKLPEPGIEGSKRGMKDGLILGKRDTAIAMMRLSVEATVRSSNGQEAVSRVKNKKLGMNPLALQEHLSELLEQQNNKCALTGLPLHIGGRDPNNPFLPSVDRIDSEGHYDKGNIQIVCKFANFWKGASDNEEFKELIRAVRETSSFEE